jgi:hypothetical protein
MEHINRQFVKRPGATELPFVADDGTGYKSIAEICKDLNEVVNIVWLSGTRKFHLCSHTTEHA